MLHYTQIDLLSLEDEALTKPVLLARLMKILHGVFRDKPETFAIALPARGFSGVRVFARERAELDFLVDAIQAHWFVRDYTKIGYPVSVPADYSGPWVSYRRFRISSAASNRHAKPGELTRGQRRSIRAKKDGMIYLVSESRSNKQRFSLFVEIVTAEGPGEFSPNSYGLSSLERNFALPDLP